MKRRLQTYVPPATFDAFVALARSQRTTISRLAARLVRTVVERSGVPEPTERATTGDRAGGGQRAHAIGERVPEAVFLQLGSMAGAYGQTRSGLAASIITSAVTSAPMLRGDERQALIESSHQLAAVGRTLNQVARALNVELKARGMADGDQLTLDLMRACYAAIERQVSSTESLLEAANHSTYRYADGSNHA